MRLICDFETASAANLKKVGAARYAEHPTTEVLCLSYKAKGHPGQMDRLATWFPTQGKHELIALCEDKSIVFVSHGGFEQYIWQSIMVPAGFPPLPEDRWEDTQAVCAWKSIPLALEKACKVLNLPFQKDMEGNKLTLSLSKKWDAHTPENLRRVGRYCETDVLCEDALDQHLGPLPPAELAIWRLTEKINHRGIAIDLDYARAAYKIAKDAAVPLTEECRDLTGGVNPTQRDAVIAWCRGQGVELENLQKGYLAELLGTEEEDSDPTAGYESLAADDDGLQLRDARDHLPAQVRRVLEIRQLCGSASVKKYPRMLDVVCADGRARGLQQYHASGTGRFGGRLIQPHNFPWDKEQILARFDPVDTIAAIKGGDFRDVERRFGCSAITVVGLGLRHALVADLGHLFEVGDYSGIEARIVLALAGQHDKAAMMAAGQDVYLDMACAIYNAPLGSLDKELDAGKRTVGKHTVLGCGFQMGGDKFHERHCPKQPIEFAHQVVEAYRTQWAPKVPELWAALKWAVNECIAFNKIAEVYGCTFRMDGAWMRIDLPSRWQTLWYYQPHMSTRAGWGPSPACWSSKAGKWERQYLYGGLLCENIVQALARGLLCSAMGRLEVRHGRPIVMTVHDEIICEVPEARADLDRFKAIMAEPVDWSQAMGVPIAVDAWTGNRYRK